MTQAQGKIVQCIGAVVDVEFPRDNMPKVYDALKMDGSALTLEVQQQLGDGVVRTIALGSTDGLKRNLIALEGKISEAKAKKNMLKARVQAAKAQEQLQSSVGNLASTSSAIEKF